MTKITSIRLSEEMVAKLDHLAASVDRPRACLIEQEIARYVEEEAWQVAAIEEGVASYRAGTMNLVPHEDVMRRLDEKIQARLGDADSRMKQPRPTSTPSSSAYCVLTRDPAAARRR